MKKILIFIKLFLKIFFITIISTKLFAYEIFKPKIDINNPINIELNSNQYNKYIRTFLKAYMGGYVNTINYTDNNMGYIEKKYKRWIKAKIKLEKNDFDIKLRITGEMKDHLNLSIPAASLKVKILNGSFHGIKRFKLFLPKTRKETNEIFWSSSLKRFGLPIYHTQYVTVNLNGTKYKAIFQEESSKEFLERNAFRETAILRNNDHLLFHSNKESWNLREKFYIDDSYILDNGTFIKNEVSIDIVSNAIALRNLKSFSDRINFNDFFIKASKKYAIHAIHRNNRKYIFNPIDNTFTPLYYDGMMAFAYSYDYNCIKNNDLLLKNLSLEFEEYSGRKLNNKEICVFEDLRKISNLAKSNRKNFLTETINFEYKEKYKFIRDEVIRFFQNNNQLSKKIGNKGLLYSLKFKNNYYLCLFKIETRKIVSCKLLNLNEYKKFLSTITNPYSYKKYVGLTVYNLGSIDISDNKIVLNNNLDYFELNKEKLYVYDSANKIKNISFNFLNGNARLIIFGNSFNKNYNFYSSVNKKFKSSLKSRYNQNLLTGCITFYKNNFVKTSLKSENINFCEDSVNIINSSGEITDIKISDSDFDSLDIDASNLNIKNIIISDARNDCVDLSFGKYKLSNLDIINCSDKGVSIGERSDVKIDKFEISNTDIGIAIKDSSILNLSNGSLLNSKKYCLATYNKKEEFGPSRLNYSNINCEKENFFEEGSLINE